MSHLKRKPVHRIAQKTKQRKLTSYPQFAHWRAPIVKSCLLTLNDDVLTVLCSHLTVSDLKVLTRTCARLASVKFRGPYLFRRAHVVLHKTPMSIRSTLLPYIDMLSLHHTSKKHKEHLKTYAFEHDLFVSRSIQHCHMCKFAIDKDNVEYAKGARSVMQTCGVCERWVCFNCGSVSVMCCWFVCYECGGGTDSSDDDFDIF